MRSELSPRIINPISNRGQLDGKNFSLQTFFAAIFFTVHKKVQERIPLSLSLCSLFFPLLSKSWSPMRSSLRGPTKLNYVFSSTPPLSSPLGNFSILNKNKFRSGVLRASAGKIRSAAGATGHSRLLLSRGTEWERFPLRGVTFSRSEWANLAPSPAYEFHGVRLKVDFPLTASPRLGYTAR